MKYIYHLVPKQMTGSTLYPLNYLKSSHPEIFSTQAKKYKGREELLNSHLGSKPWLWNDVLHFSPLDLKIIKRALINCGSRPTEGRKYFAIPIDVVRSKECCTFTLDHRKTNIYKFFDNEISEIDWNLYAELEKVPKATKTYFRGCAKSGIRPLLFMYCPHILIHGEIDVSTAEIRTW
jgi:hypothetical protein